MLQDKKISLPTEEEVLQSINEMITFYTGHAKRKGLHFNLDPEYILDRIKKSDYKCEVSGISYRFNERCKPGFKSSYSVSIERIDRLRGYTGGNIRLLCLGVNLAINIWGKDFTFEHIIPALEPNRSTEAEET